MEAILNYDWPGNIRELANVIERARSSPRTIALPATIFPTIC